jgi:hypothetical protein
MRNSEATQDENSGKDEGDRSNNATLVSPLKTHLTHTAGMPGKGKRKEKWGRSKKVSMQNPKRPPA